MILEGLLENLEKSDAGVGLDGVFDAMYALLKGGDQKYTRYAPRILASLFAAFVNAEGDQFRRAKCLFLVYLTLRTFAWADGCENALVSKCLDDTFPSWMALIVSILQTSPRSNFDVKRNALRVSSR